MLISTSINPLKASNSKPLPMMIMRIGLSLSLVGVLGLQVLNPQVLQPDAHLEILRQRIKPKHQPLTPKTKILTALGRLDAKGEILKC
jgi:hypothetical protein